MLPNDCMQATDYVGRGNGELSSLPVHCRELVLFSHPFVIRSACSTYLFGARVRNASPIWRPCACLRTLMHILWKALSRATKAFASSIRRWGLLRERFFVILPSNSRNNCTSSLPSSVLFDCGIPCPVVGRSAGAEI